MRDERPWWEHIVHIWCDDANSPHGGHKGQPSQIARFGYGPPDVPARIAVELGEMAREDLGPPRWQMIGHRPRQQRTIIDNALETLETADITDAQVMEVVEAMVRDLDSVKPQSNGPLTAERTIRLTDGTIGSEGDLAIAGAYVRYDLRCPRCPLKLSRREQKLIPTLDQIRERSIEVVSLGWLAGGGRFDSVGPTPT